MWTLAKPVGWTCLSLDQLPGSGGRVFSLVPMLLDALCLADWPPDMGAFIELDYDNESEVTVYFSPAASTVMRERLPMLQPCARPDQKTIGLLVGDPDCRAVLFPETAQVEASRPWLNG